MQLRQLAYFESAARLGDFALAAREHDLAPSVIVAQVTALERALGRQLLHRRSDGVATTACGRGLCAHLQAVVADIENRDTFGDSPSGRGDMTIGLTATLGSLDVRSAMSFLHVQFPDVTLRIVSGLLTVLLDKLAAGEVDFILGPLHPEIVKSHRAIPLSRDELILALPASSAQATATALSLGDVKTQPWATLPSGTGIRSTLESEADNQNFDPRVAFEVGPLEARSLVAAGRAVSLLPLSVTRLRGPHVAVARLAQRLPYPPIGVVCPVDRPLGSAAHTFVEYLKRHHRGSDPDPPVPLAITNESALTLREAQVLHLIAEGLTTRLVAKRLDLRPRTVDKHVERALRKLGARSRIEALAVLRARAGRSQI